MTAAAFDNEASLAPSLGVFPRNCADAEISAMSSTSVSNVMDAGGFETAALSAGDIRHSWSEP
jgi:hypothetical protein